ncbi:MAG TPA: type II toxin-antitoxin system Phd/YefM family antitoxin [Acidimicrobiales bacterium]|nr:type II toxin-antitoxin system Phd/YefM family antitoxin [Acidimicrobiales bacterium]
MSIRDLQRNPSDVVGAVERSGRPAIVTRNGKPVAAIMAVDEEALEDFVLANAPAFVKAMREADAELAAGETTTLAEHLSSRRSGTAQSTKTPRTRKGARSRRTA